MSSTQLNIFDMLSKLPQNEVPMVELGTAALVCEEAADSPILMEARLAPVVAEVVRPVDPQTPPITGAGIPPVIARVFIDAKWGKRTYYGHLYGWQTYTASGEEVRYGTVTVDGQDYRKGYYCIAERYLTIVDAVN